MLPTAVPRVPSDRGRGRQRGVHQPLDVPLLQRDHLRPADAQLQPRGGRPALPGGAQLLRPRQVRRDGVKRSRPIKIPLLKVPKDFIILKYI